jgi:DNA-binding winged helix-turn-helix (wHTH) protein/TolB-like protein
MSESQYRFAEFQLDCASFELRRQGRTQKTDRISLERIPMELLILLLERQGSVVTRQEIVERLWGKDVFVDTEHGINTAIRKIRQALRDDPEQPRFILTISGKGYRFVAERSSTDGTSAIGASAAEAVVPAQPQRSEERALPEDLRSGEKFSARKRTALVAGAAVIAITIAVAIELRRKPPDEQVSRPQAIAVLPLQNTGAAKDLEFLRIGLADDIANTLSYYPSLSMRPFTTTNQYAAADVDLRKAAREMQVADIITGHFVVAGNQLEVTLEAVDAANNRVLWRDTVRGTAHDLIGIQQQIDTRLQHGLIAALGVNSGPDASSNTSHNAEAYELYLRAMSEGNSSNSQIEKAVRLLQRAVAVDPGYSSAWAHLGHLYYYQSAFGDADKVVSRLRAKAALQRAVALDSGRIDAAADLINLESEEGDLNRAYDGITQLLRRRPDSGAVHLVYSYVLWYAGLLNDAANECEKTRALDAGTTDLATCGNVYMALGRYERAREYLRLYSGSEYERKVKVDLFLREGKQAEALEELRALPATVENGRQMLEPCLLHRPRTVAETAAAQQFHSGVMAVDDPGPKYLLAGWDSLCDQPDLAFRELRRAIEQDYCGYPEMETDPLLTKLRASPEYAEIRSLGIACQQRFLQHKNKTD